MGVLIYCCYIYPTTLHLQPLLYRQYITLHGDPDQFTLPAGKEEIHTGFARTVPVTKSATRLFHAGPSTNIVLIINRHDFYDMV